MIWIARPINSEVGSLLKFGLSVYAFYSLGLPALAVIMFLIAPIHVWAREKVRRYDIRHPKKPNKAAPSPQMVSYEKPVPVTVPLLTKSKVKSRRGNAVDHCMVQLGTLPEALLDLIHQGAASRDTGVAKDAHTKSYEDHQPDPQVVTGEKPRPRSTKLPPRRRTA